LLNIGFERDNTIETGPQGDLSLALVQFLAHNTEFHCWSVGNPELQVEADIPSIVDAQDIADKCEIERQKDIGIPTLESQLSLIERIYTKAYEEPMFVVVSDTDMAPGGQWVTFTSEDFREFLDSRGLDVDESAVDGDPYNETKLFDTYEQILQDVSSNIEATS